jgi:uncharacterized protein YndB with AHSA1/START domain
LSSNTISLTQQIESTLAYVYYAFSNKSGWMEWFSHKAYGYAKKNAMLRLHHEPEGEFAFYFTAEEPNQRLAFNFINLETMEISDAEVNFVQEEGIVTVSLEHRGISAEDYDQLKTIWETGFENLKSVLEEGKDLRVWNRPFLGVMVAEWINPEIAKQQELPVEFGMQISSTITGGGAEAAGLIKGDIISTIEGRDLHDFKEFLDLIGTVKAGDQVDLQYYRDGKKYEIKLTLSSYPVEEPPANAHDFAEKIEDYQKKALNQLQKAFEDVNPAQVEFRPGPGEWSAKETLAHLVAYENDAHVWISTMVGGCEEYPCQASHAVRIKALLSLYPTVEQLFTELKRRQRQTVAIIQELPAEFVNRKGSYARLADGLDLDFNRHHKEHLSQIVEVLEKAENLRES